jgi:hypothetical protein
MRLRAALATLAVLSAAASLSASTYTVTNTNDTGAGSLRQAITDANANPGADTIAFNIPGSDPNCDAGGVCTITPASGLPSISDALTIDGYTQPGAAVNTAASGTNAVLKIELSGASFASSGLDIEAMNVTIRGLVIGGGFSYGISHNGFADFTSNAKIVGCFIGVHADGETPWPNQFYGISFDYTGDITIGGTDPADRNLISGNTNGKGIYANLEFSTGSLVIQGNLIGTNAAANAAVSNLYGLTVKAFGAGANLMIGGSAAGAGNVISGNDGPGLDLTTLFTATATVQGNFIGTDATRAHALGNVDYGIIAEGAHITVGGAAAEGNTIVNNGFVGLWVDDTGVPEQVTFRGNSMENNGLASGWNGLGVDLANDLVPTHNDPLDADGYQNFPNVSSATPGAGTTEIQGVLHSKPSTLFTLDFYSNPACTRFPRSFLEGRTYLGSGQVSTDGSGNGSFDVVLPVEIAAGERVTATATNPDGSTSEFSQRLPFSISPTSGPPPGGTSITITGTDFAAGAAVSIGGQPATNVSITNDHSMTATTPALAPGAAYDLVVTNTDGSNGTLQKAWVADFLDVPSSQIFYGYVTTLVSNAITVGVGGGNYGVGQDTLRQQMAVFLLKAEHGLCYTPPPCTTQTFGDVPCTSSFAPWIYQLVAEGITGGCGGGNYCPTSPVLRRQMAVFLLKTEHGSSYAPPACAGVFLDVPCPSQFADWIERLAAENITGGCGGNNYCPTATANRGQMATFVVKTFNLQ